MVPVKMIAQVVKEPVIQLSTSTTRSLARYAILSFFLFGHTCKSFISNYKAAYPKHTSIELPMLLQTSPDLLSPNTIMPQLHL